MATHGAGAFSGSLVNCVLSGNVASGFGGGAYSNTLNGCVLTNNAATSGGGTYYSTVSNCTLIVNSASSYGGGACCGSLNNCTLTGNSSPSSYGGGASSGALNNCALSGNTASWGGGAYDCSLSNCSLTGNSASSTGGGAYGGALKNCIVYYNWAPSAPNYGGGTMDYCCATPLPSGSGNIEAEPRLASFSHLSADSPCRGAGSTAYTSGVDIDGEAWANPPSIGCDEIHAAAATGVLSVEIQTAYTNVSAGVVLDLRGAIGGEVTSSRWDFGDGTTATNRPFASHAWSTPGDYGVQLWAYNASNPQGISTTLVVHVVAQPVHYVALDSKAPATPYSSWATAAKNIQDAVDAATVPGALVVVSNGIYGVGGRLVASVANTNRVAVTKPLVVESLNGPAATVILGYQVPGATNGDSAVRCVYLTNGAALIGFTLTNGAARVWPSGTGAGAWCESASALLSNCVITGNSTISGGGAYSGRLVNCLLTGNSAEDGGGAYGSTLTNCTITSNTVWGSGGGVCGAAVDNCILMNNRGQYGGAADSSSMNNCLLATNSADSWGGGANFGTLNNCSLIANSSFGIGGGTFGGTLNNCLLSGNSASARGGGGEQAALNNCTVIGNTAGAVGGGVFMSGLKNCIVYFNLAPSSQNFDSEGTLPSALNYCCTLPLPPAGNGNFTNEPLFLDPAGSNLRLQSNSPCINAGLNAAARGATDLDGNPRVRGGTVDVGAYEYQSAASVISFQWLQQYGLPTDGSADYADSDGDGMNNWQEWIAGTDPTSAALVLRMLSATGAVSGVTVTWSSVANRWYSLEQATNVGASPTFSLVCSNIAGLTGTTSFIDTNTVTGAPRFYRVRVEQ